MKREDLAVLETKIYILLRRYEKAQQEMLHCRSRLQEVEASLAKKDKMLEDLKAQLDHMHQNRVQASQNIEVDEVKAELLQIVKEVDDCIKSIQ